jgi:ZIP family zinc transporter
MQELNPVLQALIAGCFTWGLTALGATVVFFTKSIGGRLLDSMLGFAGGVMIAASFWSLLAPAIDMSEGTGIWVWVPATVGFLLGTILLRGIDWILPHLHPGSPISEAEGIKTNMNKTTLLVLAITLHNIPEGLAVGVIFGAAAAGLPAATLAGAIALAIGIGIQNIPEGIAVAMPLRGEGMSRLKSFWYGQLSAVVEPIFAVVGASAVIIFRAILPYALAFAAGAMIFVVVEELIPASQKNKHMDLATMSLIIGFVVMMILDVALG